MVAGWAPTGNTAGMGVAATMTTQNTKQKLANVEHVPVTVFPQLLKIGNLRVVSLKCLRNFKKDH